MRVCALRRVVLLLRRLKKAFQRCYNLDAPKQWAVGRAASGKATPFTKEVVGLDRRTRRDPPR